MSTSSKIKKGTTQRLPVTAQCKGRVYQVRCRLEGYEHLFFIGSTVYQLDRRMKDLFAAARNPRAQSTLYNLIRRLGEDSFVAELLEEVPMEGESVSARLAYWRKTLRPTLNMNTGPK